MEKKTVAVLFGGVSSEHDVSLISVTSVLQHIPTDRYDIVKVGITKDGRWLHFTGDNDLIHNGAWESYPTNRTAFFTPDPTVGGLVVKTDTGCEVLPVDVVFPVLHGKNGEDGTLQGLLQMSGIPFVGCDLLSSAACMDKGKVPVVVCRRLRAEKRRCSGRNHNPFGRLSCICKACQCRFFRRRQ